jgi:hypothetical protein
MINVLTVHWRSPKWIDVQMDYLNRNIDEPFRVFGALNGIDDRRLWDHFHFAEDMEGGHPEKLNALAAVVARDADPSDLLLFIDGDAFPVQKLTPWLFESLERFPLVAVQRREILDDRRPHPCFCATTVGFWNEIGGDWRRAEWVAPDGRVHDDVGSKLMLQLEQEKVEWLPLVRSNTFDIDPVWFAVYGHRVYHHGAGFRAPISRVDINRVYSGRWKPMTQPSLGMLLTSLKSNPSLALRARPRHALTVRSALRKTVVQARTKASIRRAEIQSDRMFNTILGDEFFYRRLDASPDPDGSGSIRQL